MTHRNIELQVALPKVTEISKVHQQMQQQHMNQQAFFEQELLGKVEKDANRPTSPDENRAVSNEQKETADPNRQRKKQKKQDSQPQEGSHPFKGKHIDIRL